MIITNLLLLLPLALPAPTSAPPQDPGTPYCFGVACPCGNGVPDAGCTNSSGLGGRLTATGSNSIAADDLVFLGTQLPKNAVTLVALATGQAQKSFADGMLCLGDAVWRLPQHLNSGHSGTATYSGIAGMILVQAHFPLTPGDTLHFQIWNRDMPSNQTPCGGGANLTNGYTVTFAP